MPTRYAAWAGPSASKGDGAVPPVQTSSDKQRALELFAESRNAYRDGRFREAAELLAQAYRLDPVPVLLYNQARAFEGLADFSSAVTAYEHYLARDPDAKDAGAIRERVANLRREIAEREALKKIKPLPKSDVSPADLSPRRPNAIPWIAFGVGLAGATAGAIVRAVAEVRHDEAVAEPVGLTARELQDSAQSLEIAGDIALVVGSAITVAGLSWGIADLFAVGSSQPTGGGVVKVLVRPQSVKLVGSF